MGSMVAGGRDLVGEDRPLRLCAAWLGLGLLGSLALWRNFKQNPAKAIQDYKNALSLGYTKPIPVFYETAGVKFDFSKPYIQSLVEFLKQELAKL